MIILFKLSSDFHCKNFNSIETLLLVFYSNTAGNKPLYSLKIRKSVKINKVENILMHKGMVWHSTCRDAVRQWTPHNMKTTSVPGQTQPVQSKLQHVYFVCVNPNFRFPQSLITSHSLTQYNQKSHITQLSMFHICHTHVLMLTWHKHDTYFQSSFLNDGHISKCDSINVYLLLIVSNVNAVYTCRTMN